MMKTFQAVNPATGEKLPGEFQIADAAMVDAAAAKAAAAFAEYSRWDGAKRANFLNVVASKIEAQVEALAARANLETALPLPRCKGEIGRTCGQLRLYASVAAEGSWVDARIDHADAKRLPVPKPDLRSMFRPLGPVVVFGASNFPFAYSTAGGDVASALAAGCTVIVKAHTAHAGTCELVGRCVLEAVREVGAPEGTFAQIFGEGAVVGAALVKHPLVKAVGFTGSYRGGRSLLDLSAARPEPIPVFAEMGSVNPVVILQAASSWRGAEIATGLHASFTLGTGQFCTNPGIVFVPSRAAIFLTKLQDLTTATAPGVMLTAGIASAFSRGVDHLSEQPGVKVLARGAAGGGNMGQAVLLTVSAPEFTKNPALMEECFGPSTLVVQYEDVAELCAALEKVEGQLTATLHADIGDAKDVPRVQQVLEERAGRIVFDGFPTGVEVCDSQVHGGPWPSSSAAHTTSVGNRALLRFVRLIAFQNAPEASLPVELRDGNPAGILRRVNGVSGRD